MGVQSKIVVQDLAVFTRKNIVQLGLEVHANLVAAPEEGGTPVDTGWARANWIPGIGSPVTEVDGVRPPSGVPTTAGGKAQQGLAKLAALYRLELGPAFITNNVPYIIDLNNGSSSQAPSAFVQSAILRAVRSVVRNPIR